MQSGSPVWYAITLSLLIILQVYFSQHSHYTHDSQKVKLGERILSPFFFPLRGKKSLFRPNAIALSTGGAGVAPQAGAEERRGTEQEEQRQP